jgi:SNF2 family DNA or RNA helicase
MTNTWPTFNFSTTNEGIQVRLSRQGNLIPVEGWSQAVRQDALPAVAKVFQLLDEERAKLVGEEVVIPHAELVALEPNVAAILQLWPQASFLLDIQHRGTIADPDFECFYRWLRTDGRPIVNPVRTGSVLRVGDREYRLPSEQFELIGLIDTFNETPHSNLDERLARYGAFRNSLPDEFRPDIRTPNYLVSTRVAHAAAFSLRVVPSTDGFAFEPVLLSAENGVEGNTQVVPVLPPNYQEKFCAQLMRSDECRRRYTLGNGWYLTVEPILQRALSEVRRLQSADRETRRSFLRNPRAHLRERLGNEIDEKLMEDLFVETDEYISERVLDIGVRQPTAIPWEKKAAHPWLPPEEFGLLIDGEPITLCRSDLSELSRNIPKAIASGEITVEINGNRIPANENVQEAISQLEGRLNDQDCTDGKGLAPDGKKPSSTQRVGLIITDNFLELGYRRELSPREPLFTVGLPWGLKSAPKQHQAEGIRWLQEAWQRGQPGVLVADDMGLGKTFQALAFLLWLKQNSRQAKLVHRPMLVVAPTGLLKNWEQEHDQHFEYPGLDRPLHVHGARLRDLLRQNGGEAYLDKMALERADWVLTTYETLRDHQLSFAAAHFSVMVLDEAQKTKTPGTLVTDAVKAMKADFALAMTGTPIENRMADLWCIMDTVQPGLLGNLRDFSQSYERNPESGKLRELRNGLVAGANGATGTMLRRMKLDHLQGLPEKHEHVEKGVMPSVQAEAYREALTEAVKDRRKMLQVLQRLRDISLHPLRPDVASFDQYINQSARLRACFNILDQVHRQRQKALIFLESLEMQSAIAVWIQRRYQLEQRPHLINGTIDGGRRQTLVNTFQAAANSFGVMILSPRAGGVGLTLTTANHVIHLSRWWNPAVEDQCTDRVYRIGQQQPVHVYYPLAVHPDPKIADHSFDLKLNDLLDKKRTLSREMLLPPEDSAKDTEALYAETVC